MIIDFACMYSNELIAGAVGYEAVHLWEKKRERDGEEDLSTSKKLIAEFAASEVSRKGWL